MSAALGNEEHSTIGHFEVVLSKDRWRKEPASVPTKGSWPARGCSKASSSTCKSHHQSLWNEPPRLLEGGHAEVESMWPAYKQKTDLETVFGLWTTSAVLKSPSTSPSHVAACAATGSLLCLVSGWDMPNWGTLSVGAHIPQRCSCLYWPGELPTAHPAFGIQPCSCLLHGCANLHGFSWRYPGVSMDHDCLVVRISVP